MTKTNIILLIIVAGAICLRLAIFGGYTGLDDGEYARFAYNVSNGEYWSNAYAGPAVFPLRVGVIYPTALAFHYVGFSEWSMVLVPFASSLAAILLSYVLATALFGRNAGLIAAALYACIPIDMREATILLPDLPAALFGALGLTLIILLMQSSMEKKPILFMGGLCSGLAFGVSWLCKESVVYLVPTCAVLMAMSLRGPWRKAVPLWGGVTGGSLLILSGETIVYATMTGDWLFRAHEIQRNYAQWSNAFFTEGSNFGWPKGGSRIVALFKRVFMKGPELILFNSSFLYLPLVGMIAAIHGFYWRDKAFLLPSIWLITVVVMFNFGSNSLTSYTPLPLFDRYFYPIIFPSVLLSSALLAKCIFRTRTEPEEVVRERVFWGGTVLLLLVLSGAASFYWEYKAQGPSTWTAEARTLSGKITPSSHLYADLLTLRCLRFFSQYPEQTNWIDFDDLSSEDDIRPGSFVMINKNYLNWLDVNKGMWLSKSSGYKSHEFYQAPPSSWVKLFDNGNAAFYEVRR